MAFNPALLVCGGIRTFVNTVGGASLLAKFEGLILVLHVIGFFAVLIPLVYMSEHATAQDVFEVWVNDGGWETQGFPSLSGSLVLYLHSLEETPRYT